MAIMKMTSVTLVHLIGTPTAPWNTLGGGCEGFFKSSIIVRLGTISIVIRYTTTIPPDNANPMVWIGFIGTNTREMNPMIVVNADNRTALPVELMASDIFSLGEPLASA